MTPEQRMEELEAEVARLRAQLAAQRRAPAARRDPAQLVREQHAAEAVRPFVQHTDGERHVCQVARMLLHLSSRPGEICPYKPIMQAIRDPNGIREPGAGLIKVVLFHARKALEALDVPARPITTVRGLGLILEVTAAARVRQLLGDGHG